MGNDPDNRITGVAFPDYDGEPGVTMGMKF
jgi:hypothetical protein